MCLSGKVSKLAAEHILSKHINELNFFIEIDPFTRVMGILE